MNVRLVAMPLIAAGIATGIWLLLPTQTSPTVPAATWRLGSDSEFRQARNYDEVPPNTPVRLSYTCSVERYVYVFSHSTEDGTLLMFPSPDVKGSMKNPLPAGNTVLPGSDAEKDWSWSTREEILATTTYVVVASSQPVEELESLLPNLRRWTNSVLPNKSMQVTSQEKGNELIGSPRTDWPSSLLKRAADRSFTETLVNGPMHPDDATTNVWTASVRVKIGK
jgi:hypothetical protein